MNKKEFIESYISKLEEYIENFQNEQLSEDDLVDCILEVKGVFSQEAPEIENAIWLGNGSAERDARVVIGILKLHMINESEDFSTMENEFDKSFRELKLEYEGIKATIEDYTNEGNIINYLNRLKEAIESEDISNIKYCLEKILRWYHNNISRIHSSKYVYNQESHDENLAKVQHFHQVFVNATNDCLSNKTKLESNNEPVIFLSHKSDDKKYADALEKFIIGLGVKNNQLIYTSHPLHKIPLDANIYDYLRKRINGNTFMIFLWSDKYLDSPACMNEMGAAWVIQSDYTNIYVPSFSFGNPKYRECAVDSSKMGAVLNGDAHCKASMIELKNKIQSIFKLSNDEKTSQYLLDNFIQDIKEAE